MNLLKKNCLTIFTCVKIGESNKGKPSCIFKIIQREKISNKKVNDLGLGFESLLK